MAEADVLPYDYESYGNEITSDLKTSERSCHDAFGEQSPSFSEVEAAAARFTQAGHALAVQATDRARKRRNSTMYSCKPNDRCC